MINSIKKQVNFIMYGSIIFSLIFLILIIISAILAIWKWLL